MGFGDWIMATSQVRRLNEKTGRRVVVVDPRGKVRYVPEIFDHNPRISIDRNRYTAQLVNAGGARPYIAGKTNDFWTWRRWDIAPGEIWLSREEKARAKGLQRDAFLIEPNTKLDGSNKAWRWERFQSVVDSGIASFVQIGPPGTHRLKHVEFIETPTFRHALITLSALRGYVGTEGGLHHAAAAIGVRAVVLWSHFIAPEFTGYTTQTNIRHAAGWCGARKPCATCRASMDAITVDEVVNAIRELK